MKQLFNRYSHATLPCCEQTGKVKMLLLFLISASLCSSNIYSANETESQAFLSNVPEEVVQVKVLTGKVVDTNGEPVIGANVIEKNAHGNGVISDLNGAFSLRVKPDAVIEVSYIGYVKKKLQQRGETL